MKLTIALILTALFCLTMGIALIKSIQFNQDCGGYLERAANANTIEIAEKELQIAISYLEKEELTSGYTSVLWRTPNEDIGFWYNNIKTSYNELISLSDSSSSLEKSNMLIKLRETLIDHGEKGDRITVPSGISRYPQNALFGSFAWIFLISTVIAWFVVTIDDY